jgi:uncharacterized OB-fold protein
LTNPSGAGYVALVPEAAPRKPRVPIEPGFFVIPDAPGAAPRLLGSRCTACGEVFFPRRVVCARCLARGCEDVTLGPRGRLFTFTWCHLPRFGSRHSDGGYGVGQVDLPEGPRVQAVLAGRREELHIGLEMELDLEVLGETRGGEEIVIHRFRPCVPATAAQGAPRGERDPGRGTA